MTLTAKDVAEISRLLEESSFDELALELDGLKLTLRRNAAAAPESAAPGTVLPQPRSSVPATPAQSDDRTVSVTAPLLGTFYRSPKPGAPPFVEVGSAVEDDTVIGIIEVMKLMNTVRAGACGRVADIVAKDGALVEYGETLMHVSKEAQG